MPVRIRSLGMVLLGLVLAVAFTQPAAAEYPALAGVEETKALFDCRDADPQSALDHLGLVLMTLKDKDLTAVDKNPRFVVVFMGPSVKLLITEPQGYSPEQNRIIAKLAKTLGDLAKAGVVLEVCMVAVNYFKADPAKLLPELKQVPNGWVSSIGYQAQGYGLIPIY